MNKKKQILLLTLLLLTLSAKSQTEVMGKIEKVTVYPSSALVEKTFTSYLQKGENKFIIHGNSQGFSDLHFEASPDWFICSMNIQPTTFTENEVLSRTMPSAAYTQYQSLKAQWDEVSLKISNANILVGALSQQSQALYNLKALRNTSAFDTIVNLKAQFEYQRKELQAINTTISKTQRELQDLTARQRQLQLEMDALLRKHTGGSAIQRQQNDICVTIFSNKNIPNANIAYAYRETFVACGYRYDVMLHEDHKTAIFSLKASVSQNTGENWNNCHLSFSTYDAGFAGYDSQLQPYMLDFRNLAPVQKPQAGYLQRNMVMAEASLDASASMKTSDLSLNSYSVRSNQTLSREYTLQALQSIPSGSQSQMILLQNDTTQSLFARFATPKNEEKVHFTALLPHWEDLGLLEAPCNVYLNNRFVSTSSIQTQGSGDTLRFAVGQDPNVLVKRKLTLSSPEKGGLISKEVSETVTITITLKNTKSEAIELRIKDQVPIAANSEIQVLDIRTDGGILENRTGIVRWNIPLKPLEQKTLTLSYTVKYPKEKEHLINLR